MFRPPSPTAIKQTAKVAVQYEQEVMPTKLVPSVSGLGQEAIGVGIGGSDVSKRRD